MDRGLAGRDEVNLGQFVVLWLGAAILIAIPLCIGSALGGLYATRGQRDKWPRIRKRLTAEQETKLFHVVLGRSPAPRAWDHYFSERPTAYLRVRTTSDEMVAGLFARASYAGGFPDPTDLYLERAYAVDGTTGAIGDALDYSLYIAADRISLIEILPAPVQEPANAEPAEGTQGGDDGP